MFRNSLVVAVLAATTTVFAQAPATAPPISGKLGTPVQAFNGKDYTGWVWVSNPANPQTKLDDTWSIKDGAMSCTGKPNGQIRTEKDFGPDYVLTVEYRHVTVGGGGMLFGITGPDGGPPKQMQVQGTFGQVGDLIDQGGIKWTIDQSRAPRPDRMTKIGPLSEKPLGEWNVLETIVDHGNITIKVNGQLQNLATEAEDLTGKIGFQSEGAAMEFRKVQVTPIGRP
ncbi:MAG: hypothetical protein A3G27_06555 [Betaproteobacteria bacterium RIFCSPLOWO2_12_FULL_66_14]|nr:MAG: hypothetical protein A3G27_06555 [Betaproteobacteria bacterium RIFCSPLOWO2_12_FULL_66_14]